MSDRPDYSHISVDGYYRALSRQVPQSSVLQAHTEETYSKYVLVSWLAETVCLVLPAT